MRLLNDTVNSDSYEFISVAGDNYYPAKLKSGDVESKIFDEKELKSGFDCLPKEISINVIMGNHDYERNLNMYNGNDEIIGIDGCQILDTEYKLNQINPNINTSMYNFNVFDSKTKILMIDTTIYDDKYIERNIDCYLKHPEIKPLFDTLDTLNSKVVKVRDNQHKFINDNISSLNNGDNLIIIGHHPISGFKYKKGKIDKTGNKHPDNMLLIDSPGEPFLDMLYNTIHLQLKDKDIKYYYLCADLHQYQIGNISISPPGASSINDYMFIKQYIVGTGGADLDPYKFPIIQEKQNQLNVLEFTNLNINYLMTEEEVNSSGQMYGILECISNDSGDLMFNFIETSMQRRTETPPHNKSIDVLKGLISKQYGGKLRKRYKRSFKSKKIIKKSKKSKRKNNTNFGRKLNTKRKKTTKSKKYRVK